jgi:CRISPR system CASCADE complex protein CasA/Cse1
MIEKRFNLIDEKWIPIADTGLASLHDVFSDGTLTALGGDPVQKISVFKLLLAIAQSAWTPSDETEWRKVGVSGMSERVLRYLEKWHDAFWLYGDKPFLQMPEIAKAKKKSYGELQMMVSTGNTTVLTQYQIEKALSDSDKALLLIQTMCFALGGKKGGSEIVLTEGYEKSKSLKYGSSLGQFGFLHNFVFTYNLQDSIYINLFTKKEISSYSYLSLGIGIAPWEQMPLGENDSIAQKLKQSYMGRLLTLSRFLLFTDTGAHFTEGIIYNTDQERMLDPSISVCFSGKEPVALKVNTEIRPWRKLTALLSYVMDEKNKYECPQIKLGLSRMYEYQSFSIWSGGVRVHANSGEQYLSGTDDFVESEVQLSGSIFDNASDFITTLNNEMEIMDTISGKVYVCVIGYFKQLKVDGDKTAKKATGIYWQLCERIFQKLVDSCATDTSGNKAKEYQKIYLAHAYSTYDQFCPNQSARQMEAWAANRFGFEKKLTKETN